MKSYVPQEVQGHKYTWWCKPKTITILLNNYSPIKINWLKRLNIQKTKKKKKNNKE